MSNTFIQEAFKQFYLTEDAEEFSLNVSGPDDVESFLDIVAPEEDEEVISDVYDLEAEAKEDLKQSYLGKVILDCNVCHSNVFFNKDEITEDEDGLCCVDIECPYCMSNEGYTIIGEVKPYQEEEDVDIEDIETEEVPEEPVDDVEIDVEETEEEPEEEEETEEVEEELEEGLKADEVKELRGDEEINGADGPLKSVDELEGSDEIRGPKYTELNEGCEEEVEEGLLGAAGGAIAGHAVGAAVGHPVLGTIGGAIAGNAIQNHFSDDKNESLEECGDPENMEEMEEGVAGWAAGRTAGQAVGTAVGSLGGPVGATVGRVVGGMVGGKLGSAAQDKLSEECEEEMEEGLISGDTSINIGNGNFSGNSILSGNKLGIGGILGKQEMNEDIEDVSINTDDENITMTTKEDGGVVVETSPKEEAVVEDEVTDDTEMIAPLEPETEADIDDAVEMNDKEDEEVLDDDEEFFDDMDFEEFDEESFDNLGESYLKRCYENVTSFKTSNISLNENKEFVIEGKIGFDSGNVKDTQFVFSKKSDENGRLKLEGYNRQISTGKKTFKLNCSVNDKSLVCESLNYNYKGKNDLNESVRVYGTVKRK